MEAALKYSDVAKKYNLAEDTLRQKVMRREIPHHKLGKGKNAPVRFDEQELDEWWNDCRVPTRKERKQKEAAHDNKTL